jgi:uncharacterized membrane protein
MKKLPLPMKNEFLPKWLLPPKWLRFVILAVLVLGVLFRFIGLDQKPYDTDEVRGILRASGYTSQEFTDRLFNGDVISITEVQKYQKPNAERNVGDAMRALTGNPEHPPLYYLSARFWMQWFDASVGARYLAAVLGVLILPCAYWFCLELFESPLVGWVLVTLLSISPFQVLYAQQARQYSLWIAAIFLASGALLKARRSPTLRHWGIYALTVALGLYSHLFFVYTAVGHGIYVALMEGWQRGKLLSRSLIAYILASLAGLMLFAPWIWVFITSQDRTESTTRWVSSFKADLLTRFTYWIHNLSLVFFDFNQDMQLPGPLPLKILWLAGYAAVIGLVGYAIYFLCRRTPPRIWVFVLLLIGVTAVAQVIPDLLKGGRRSLLPRYLVCSYVGIQIAVAYLLASQMSALKQWQQRFWQVAFAIVLSVGILSNVMSAQAASWWTKGSSSINPEVAPYINQATRPIVISDASHTFILSLSHFLDTKTQVQLFRQDTLETSASKLEPTKADRAADIFLYFPTDELLQNFTEESQYQAEVLVGKSKWFPNRNWLYRLRKTAT